MSKQERGLYGANTTWDAAIFIEPHQFKDKMRCSVDYLDTIKIPVLLIDPKDQKPRNGSEWTKELMFTCQVAWDAASGKWETYAYELRYQGFMILESHQIAVMAKVMTRYQSALKRLPIQPASFGQFIALIGAAIGVKRTVMQRSGNSTWYPENEYYTDSMKSAQYHVDQMVLEARKRVMPERLAIAPAEVA